jgi:hypothetical protein
VFEKVQSFPQDGGLNYKKNVHDDKYKISLIFCIPSRHPKRLTLIFPWQGQYRPIQVHGQSNLNLSQLHFLTDKEVLPF